MEFKESNFYHKNNKSMKKYNLNKVKTDSGVINKTTKSFYDSIISYQLHNYIKLQFWLL